jgi:hypothetical protein
MKAESDDVDVDVDDDDEGIRSRYCRQSPTTTTAQFDLFKFEVSDLPSRLP